jgi:hypothetical protein
MSIPTTSSTLKQLLEDVQTALPPCNEELHDRIRVAIADLGASHEHIKREDGTFVGNTSEDVLVVKNHAAKAFKDKNFVEALHFCDQVSSNLHPGSRIVPTSIVILQAVALEPAEATHFSNRSLAHLSLCNFDAAVVDAEVAVRLKPEWAKAHYRRGVALLAKAEGFMLDPNKLESPSLTVSLEKGVDLSELLIQAFEALATASTLGERTLFVISVLHNNENRR